MRHASFLDSGVVLGFCFEVDLHHQKCRTYLVDHDYDFYISSTVSNEYLKKRPDLAERYSDAIFSHVGMLKRSKYEGQLDSFDQAQIRDDVLDRDSPAYNFLYDYYDNQLPNFIQLDELDKRLRNLARDIEQHVQTRRAELEELIEEWERVSDYPDIEEALSEIHDEDRVICLDAHDLAVNNDGKTELATTNPNDLGAEGYKAVILEVTELDDVISLAVTG